MDNEDMSQQGERPTRRPAQEDDWWSQLYEDAAAADDTGPTPTPDSLDAHFTTAEAVAAPPDPVPPPRGVPAQPPRGGDGADGPGVIFGPAEAGSPEGPGPTGQETPSDPAQAGSGPAVPEPLGFKPSAPEPPGFKPPAPEPPGFKPRAYPAEPPRPSGADAPGTEPRPGFPEPPGPPPAPPATYPAEPQAPPRAYPAEPPAPPRAYPAEPPSAPPRPPDGVVRHVGDGPPTYDAEPTALPLADPEELEDLVADTVLDGARYGSWVVRSASVRGDSARYRGEPRRDSLLTARFGSGPGALVLVAMATGARATPGAHRAAADACEWIGRAVGLSHARLAEDIRAGRRGDLKSGLHRLTDRSLGKLRAGAAEQGLDPEEYAADLRCLLMPADPACRTRVFFGVGSGGLFRLRDGEWQDLEPDVPEQRGAPVVGYGALPASAPAQTPEGDRLTMDLGITTPPSPYEPAPEPPRDPFRFRASVARPGDTLLLCTAGLAEPLRGEPDLGRHLARRWAGHEPPGLAAFLADTQVRVKGYADDRTAAAVWEG